MRGSQASTTDRKAKSTLSKLNRIKTPKKNGYQPSPKKGSPKKRKYSTTSQETAKEQHDDYNDTDNSQDIAVIETPKLETPTVDIIAAPTRGSSRDKKKRKRYAIPPNSHPRMKNRTMTHCLKEEKEQESPPTLKEHPLVRAGFFKIEPFRVSNCFFQHFLM